MIIGDELGRQARPSLGISKFEQIMIDHLPSLELLAALRQLGQEDPILLQDFAVVDDEATCQLDADGGFEHAPIHGSKVEDGDCLHGGSPKRWSDALPVLIMVPTPPSIRHPLALGQGVPWADRGPVWEWTDTGHQLTATPTKGHNRLACLKEASFSLITR